jgi:hypothetical protein
MELKLGDPARLLGQFNPGSGRLSRLIDAGRAVVTSSNNTQSRGCGRICPDSFGDRESGPAINPQGGCVFFGGRGMLRNQEYAGATLPGIPDARK